MDWLIEAGNPIQRVAEHDRWLTTFGADLDSLPEPQRRQSVLPLLHAFGQPGAPWTKNVPAQTFRSAVQETKPGGNSEIPGVTTELICKYATDLKTHGLL